MAEGLVSLRGLSAASVAALAIALSSTTAFAQTASEADQAAQEAAIADEPIIVTGVTRSTRQIEATNTINVLRPEDIQRLAPISTADLLQNIPGIYAEGSSAGEAFRNRWTDVA